MEPSLTSNSNTPQAAGAEDLIIVAKDIQTARLRAFGDALRSALKVHDMTQEDLAEKLNVRQGNISDWVRGVTSPRDPELTFTVERAIGVPPGSLSTHLGYLPLEAVESVASVRASIMAAPELTDAEKTVLLGAYEAAIRAKRGRRR